MGRHVPILALCGAAALLAVAAAEGSGAPDAVAVEPTSLIVRGRPSDHARKVGVLRRGAVVKVLGQEKSGRGCSGAWLRIEGEGFICTDYVSEAELPARPSPLEPVREGDVAAYGRVSRGPTPLCQSPRDLSRETPAACRQAPLGALLRLDRLVPPSDWAWRTMGGEFLRASRVTPVTPLVLGAGEAVGEGGLVEGAAILREEAPVRAEPSEGSREVGRLARFERVRVGRVEGGYVQLLSGGWVPRRAVRRLRRRSSPEGLAEGRRWLAVDLDQQTLVAYEGDRPVFATLVSTGRGWDWTPEGVYRVQKKAVSDDMGNEDGRSSYLVEDVPWVLYYQDDWAVHGAFWHDELGARRSHGCVNLALEDARWVFDWADPPLPRGWHVAFDGPGRRGSPVVIFR